MPSIPMSCRLLPPWTRYPELTLCSKYCLWPSKLAWIVCRREIVFELFFLDRIKLSSLLILQSDKDFATKKNFQMIELWVFLEISFLKEKQSAKLSISWNIKTDASNLPVRWMVKMQKLFSEATSAYDCDKGELEKRRHLVFNPIQGQALDYPHILHLYCTPKSIYSDSNCSLS